MTRVTSIRHLLLKLVAGTLVAMAAFSLGYLVGRPFLGAVWGLPLGYGWDSLTWQVFFRAIVAQSLFLVPMFVMLGYCGQADGLVADAVSAANPVTVGLGYWLYYSLILAGGHADIEYPYFHLSGCLLWLAGSVLLLAPCTYAGGRLRHAK